MLGTRRLEDTSSTAGTVKGSVNDLDMSQCYAGGSTKPKKTIVTVSITTKDAAAFATLMKLSQGSAEETEALKAIPITAADGSAFTLCTKAAVAGSGPQQIINPAPSPPAPPTPPPALPPSPPFNILPGGLDILDFVNVSNPGSKAVGMLLQQAAATVSTVAAAAVGASVAAGVAASAAGGAAGGGAPGPASLGGAQRNSMYSNLGGPPTTCDDPAATSKGSWTMGRLGAGSSKGPCEEGGVSNKRRLRNERKEAYGRRLQSRGGGGSSGGSGNSGGSASKYDSSESTLIFVESEDEESFEQRLLVSAMVDVIMSVLMILGALVGLHVLVLIYWKYCMNRRCALCTTRGTRHAAHVAAPSV